MKCLVLILSFLFSTVALAIDIGLDPNNNMNRTLTGGDRSQVQAAVPYNAFYCDGCVKMELARRKRLGDFELSPEARGAVVPGRSQTPSPLLQSPSTDSDGSSDGTN